MPHYPKFCSGIKCTENTTGLHWNGEFAQRYDYLLKDEKFDSKWGDHCDAMGVFTGSYDDEWSILFKWSNPVPPTDYTVREYWAEAWYDHETQDIHCCVRETWDDKARRRVYGPNPSQKYCRGRTTKTLEDFAKMLENFPWDHFTTNRARFSLDAERARSREYKDRLMQQERNTALAMALHERLGKRSGISCLGGDMMADVVKYSC